MNPIKHWYVSLGGHVVGIVRARDVILAEKAAHEQYGDKSGVTISVEQVSPRVEQQLTDFERTADFLRDNPNSNLN